MAKAKKLPSGNWNIQVYSHTDSAGKRYYESFTAPTKKEAEFLAAEFKMERERLSDCNRWTLGEAIDNYIELKRPVLSPTTIEGYERIRKYSFQEIMDIPIRKLNEDTLSRAVQAEMERPHRRGGTQSAKSVRNAYGLVSSTLARYLPGRVYRVDLPRSPRKIRTLPEPAEIFQAVKGTKIELAVLLAMWLSFSESEIRGLTKSKSIDGDYITIREVMVRVGGQDMRKELAKTDSRIRRHRMPAYIKDLIDQVEGDVLVPYIPSVLIRNLKGCLKKAGLQEITFHDLRHVNASVMAALRIPDRYAQERGGWSSDRIMKAVYMETFSSEREMVDDTIDSYFQGALGIMQDGMQDDSLQHRIKP